MNKHPQAHIDYIEANCNIFSDILACFDNMGTV